MAWTFRKRKKLLPGVHLNISPSGFSANIGPKGANLTFGPNGTYVNVGAPGTGIRNRKKLTSAFSDKPQPEFTMKDLNRFLRLRGCFYVFLFIASYIFIAASWMTTVLIYTQDNYWWLLPGIIALFFIVNTIRLYKYQKKDNTTSTFIVSIVLSIVLLAFCIIFGLAYFFTLGWKPMSLFAIFAVVLSCNLYYCYKYRIPKMLVKTRKKQVVKAGNNLDFSTASTSGNVLTSQFNSTTIISQPEKVSKDKPFCSVDYEHDNLSFVNPQIANALSNIFGKELVNVCSYIVSSQRCVISDIQAELGISYVKVVAALKVLEKAHILQVHGNRRLVMVDDDTTTIRLLCRYAKENNLATFPLDRLYYNGNLNKQAIDPLFKDVARYVVTKQEGNTGRLQRHFVLGYNRIGAIADLLESFGIVGPSLGPKGRDVLIQSPEDLEHLFKKMGI